MGENIKDVSVRKDGHLFEFFVTDSGRIDYRIDNGEIFTAKQLKDGKVFFIKKQELIIRNELIELDGVELYDEDFLALKEAQDEILKEKQEKSMQRIERKIEIARIENEREAVLHYVDSWKKKIRTYKNRNRKKEKYCIHEFRIGNDKYRFIERNMEDVGVVINPDYIIDKELPDIGGIPKKYGELIFWDYLFPNEGWKRVRVLTNNEMICLEIIQKFGFFAAKEKDKTEDEKKTKKEGAFPFGKKKTKDKNEKEESIE